MRKYYQNRPVFEKSHYNNYNEFFSTFKWNIPDYFNIGYACCDHHVNIGNGDDIALYDHTYLRQYTFNDIYNSSSKLCNALRYHCNINIADRIGILLPQSYECVVSHIATYKLGCIALPLFILFGTDSLTYRINDSQCKILITNKDCLDLVLSIKHELPSLEYIIVSDLDNYKHSHSDYILSFSKLLCDASSSFECINTLSNDPALIIYTSGTTGNPKGCLHAHRVLLGRLPGTEIPQYFNSILNKCFWTPADYAWIGGLLGGLIPTLYYGKPIVCYQRNKFDPQETLHILKQYNVTTSFLPPTALKLMKQFTDNIGDSAADKYYHNMLGISSGGEYLGEHLHEWGQKHFNVIINEFYSQTECSVIISNASQIFEYKLGSMGKCVPGHCVEIIDNNGNIITEINKIGMIGVLSPDPVMFLKYWNDSEQTSNKYILNNETNASWLITGDLASKDSDNYFYYSSRDDDVIISAGYRIGPSEIENVCMKHKLIINCAVIGVPDKLRNHIVKAFIVLDKSQLNNCNATDIDLNILKKEIQYFVKQNVGKHEYPKIIDFVDELPMTITKKIQRHKLRELTHDTEDLYA